MIKIIYKTELVAIKMTPEEKEKLKIRAEKEKVSVSEYIRKRIFKK